METVELILRILAMALAGAAVIGLIHALSIMIQTIRNLANPK